MFQCRALQANIFWVLLIGGNAEEGGANQLGSWSTDWCLFMRSVRQSRKDVSAGVVAAGAAYEEDFIEIDPSQPESGAAVGRAAAGARVK